MYVWNPAAGSVARRPDRVIGIVQLDGLQLLLSDSDTPADVREYLEAKQNEAYAALRAQMKKDGFKPSTRPAD